MSASFYEFLHFFSNPSVGLSSLAIISYLAATILPLGSEPFFLVCLTSFPEQVVLTIGVASFANTLGGMTTWWMGKKAVEWKAKQSVYSDKVIRMLDRFGPKTLLMAWLPIGGDLIAGLGGWAQFPFWPCFVYMLIGKTGRYVALAYLAHVISWSF